MEGNIEKNPVVVARDVASSVRQNHAVRTDGLHLRAARACTCHGGVYPYAYTLQCATDEMPHAQSFDDVGIEKLEFAHHSSRRA